MSTVIVAEKPSVARDIAGVVGARPKSVTASSKARTANASSPGPSGIWCGTPIPTTTAPLGPASGESGSCP